MKNAINCHCSLSSFRNLVIISTAGLSVLDTRSTQEYLNYTEYYMGSEFGPEYIHGGQLGNFM